MPVVEIDEVELQRLKRVEGVVGTILKSPAARKHLAKAQKVVNPEDPLAKEADAVDPIEARFSDLAKANEDLRKQIADDKAEREQNAKLADLRKMRDDGFAKLRADRWTDDGLKKLEELMERKGILDPLDAAAIYERDNPPPAPITPSQVGAWNFLQLPNENADADLKALIESKGQNESLVDKMAMSALQDFRSQQPVAQRR